MFVFIYYSGKFILIISMIKVPNTLYFFKNYLKFFCPLALQPNSDLGRFHETFRFTSVTRSRTVGRTSWTGNQLVARPLHVHKHRITHTTQTLNIRAQNGIRTHRPGVRASEDSSWLRPLGYRERPSSFYTVNVCNCLKPWRWRQHVPQKYRDHCQHLHGANTLQKNQCQQWNTVKIQKSMTEIMFPTQLLGPMFVLSSCKISYANS
jgi:hypothetical protein